MRIVLVEPEIPANTGNVVRTCAVTGTELHLVRPLGFSIEDKHLKRAGLDYWHKVKIYLHDSLADLLGEYPEGRFFYFSTRGRRLYSDFSYRWDDFLVFGKETAGLPEHTLRENEEFTLRIPMIQDCRSINLSNSVAVVVFEALRQQGFPGMA